MTNIEIESKQDERGMISRSDVVLVTPRDPEVWGRDGRVKEAKKALSSQHATNYLLERYLKSQRYLRANLHLTIGRQRL